MAQAKSFFDLQNNPFLNADMNPFAPKQLGDMFNGYSVPEFDFDNLAETQRKNFEALAEAQSKAFAGVQEALNQQAGTFREIFEDSSAAWKALAETEEPGEKLGKQADLAKKNIERTAASMQKASDTVMKSQKEAMKILEARAEANLDAFKAGLKK